MILRCLKLTNDNRPIQKLFAHNVKYNKLLLLTILYQLYLLLCIHLLNSALEHVCLCIERLINVV